MISEDIIVALGVDLITVAGRNSISAIRDKVAAAKARKNNEEIINTMEEIINNLIMDKNELERISLEYKKELERAEISDEDINYLHNSIKSFLNALERFDMKSSLEDDFVDSLLELISVDTLRTMQLLGYNYKEAIGVPLTEVTSKKILQLSKSGESKGRQKGKKQQKRR